MTWRGVKWATLQLLFVGYACFSMFSVVGGYLTGPVMSYLFLGNRRFTPINADESH